MFWFVRPLTKLLSTLQGAVLIYLRVINQTFML